MVQLKMRYGNIDAPCEVPSLPEGYLVRPYEERDMPSLVATLEASFPGMEWTEEKARKSLREDPTVLETYVIVHGTTVVATASAQHHESQPDPACFLHWVATDPAHQGKKLGMIISYAVVHHFKRLGFTEAFLMTDDWRTSAITIYLRMGFRPCNCDESHPHRWETIFTTTGITRPD